MILSSIVSQGVKVAVMSFKGELVRYLNVMTVKPIFSQPAHIDCSEVLLQNMCLASSVPLMKSTGLDSRTPQDSRLNMRQRRTTLQTSAPAETGTCP